MRDFQLPGRSTVHAAGAMAATAHPIATLEALDVLRRGGNAVDAAVTATALLGVIEPAMTGIGGDCFVLFAPKGRGPVIGLNGSGRAPAAAKGAWFVENGFDRIPYQSPHAVTIPGAVEAWDRLLRDHGTMGLEDALGPAIRYAEEGFLVAPRVAWDWTHRASALGHDEAATAIYLPKGRTPRTGERVRFPKLARSLRLIAREGPRAFYEGPIAEDLVTALRAKGGLHTLEDFARHRSDYVTPISTAYRGYDIFEIPPNGQGITALVLLNILSGYELAALDPLSAERLHIETEAGRLAYALRDAAVADPEKAEVPVDALLSERTAAGLRAMIDPARAIDMADVRLPGLATAPEHADTTYVTVVDEERNAVSFINSLYQPFGSGIAGSETGILMQNRGACFVTEPGHPNAIDGGKRPLHTIIPGMVMREGRVALSFGVMGGGYQPVGHAHLLSNLLDHGMDLQEAIDCPRVFHEQGGLGVERGIPEETVRALEARGHHVGPARIPHGGAQAIAIDWARGALTAASDPRKDGVALGY